MIRVLLIEDNPDDAEQTILQLQAAGEELEIKHVDCLRKALLNLEVGNTYDLILLDLGLPDVKGDRLYALEVLGKYKIPITVVSGTHDSKLITKVKESGAQYLSKDEVLGSPGSGTAGSMLANALLGFMSRQQTEAQSLDLVRLAAKIAAIEAIAASNTQSIKEWQSWQFHAQTTLALTEDNLKDTRNDLAEVEERLSKRLASVEATKTNFSIENLKGVWQIVVLVCGGCGAVLLPKLLEFLQKGKW